MPVESFTSTVSSSHGVSDSPFIWGVRNLLRNPRPPYQGLLLGLLRGHSDSKMTMLCFGR
jgi:hypothetical protein